MCGLGSGLGCQTFGMRGIWGRRNDEKKFGAWAGVREPAALSGTGQQLESVLRAWRPALGLGQGQNLGG